MLIHDMITSKCYTWHVFFFEHPPGIKHIWLQVINYTLSWIILLICLNVWSALHLRVKLDKITFCVSGVLNLTLINTWCISIRISHCLQPNTNKDSVLHLWQRLANMREMRSCLCVSVNVCVCVCVPESVRVKSLSSQTSSSSPGLVLDGWCKFF